MEEVVTYLLRNEPDKYRLEMDIVVYMEDNKLVVVDWSDDTYKAIVSIRADNYYYHNGTVQLKRDVYDKVKVVIKNRYDEMIVKAYACNSILSQKVKEYYETPRKRVV